MAGEAESHCQIRYAFATAFRNWRLKNNIPMKRVATDLGVSIATVSYWESGRQFPTGRHLEMLADYTGLPPSRLFCVNGGQVHLRRLPAGDAQKKR